MKMVSSQSALFRFLTFPHAGGTVYIWRSHCVCFYWIFGCASHQIFNRIIWCFRQSAVNHGLSRGCTPAGPPQCCEDVAYFRRCCRCIFTMKVVFQRDVFKKNWFSSRNCVVFSQEKLLRFGTFTPNCAPLASSRPAALYSAALQTEYLPRGNFENSTSDLSLDVWNFSATYSAGIFGRQLTVSPSSVLISLFQSVSRLQ